MTNATYRDGQRGYASAPDQNGFCTFESTTGARFSAHVEEIARDGTPDLHVRDLRTYHYRVERKDGVLMSYSRVQTRAGQSSAKHAARVDDAMRG